MILLLLLGGVLALPQDSISQTASLPSFVIDYAPLVYLYSSDPYRPSDIGAQVVNTQPQVNYNVVSGAPDPLTLDNLDELNALGGPDVYLTSKDDVETYPAWLLGATPDSAGKTNNAVTAAIILNDRGAGRVDAFYMYFYAFNWGGKYFGREIGHHVGDWEHNMIRFENGKPTYIWYSQHENGQAFAYRAVEKEGLRPLVFSSNGSHANYGTTGTHDHTIPNLNLPEGLIEDYTDKGIRWDPMLSAYSYSYNAATGTFTPYDPSHPTAYLKFVGRWGDKYYPNDDPRQQEIFGLRKYSDGPTGPEDKQLNREKVCPDNGIPCILRQILVPRDI